ncbi:hypothetical protein BISA_1939 [Bifidobacterium saguini DSM 23967]|uniref:Uncharacterized protein n=2 Tax=Bifidobacterium saguini TaxID=762210 RepID=A0A087D610_9BIFI|nr:hypothetical protein [Bifidobacterium saguini]KFI90960.1 hypothetical protein BISA_1939 [Bifidobacterium saguini DSM 23967]QTB91452.1 hypothetical protein BSD967_03245 [Bifidobacterium saguini]
MSTQINVVVHDRHRDEVMVSVIGDDGSAYSRLVGAADLQQWIDELRLAQRQLGFFQRDSSKREAS